HARKNAPRTPNVGRKPKNYPNSLDPRKRHHQSNKTQAQEPQNGHDRL
ncbi:5316_t:CDS:1, partial [Gigaspora rosea]